MKQFWSNTVAITKNLFIFATVLRAAFFNYPILTKITKNDKMPNKIDIPINVSNNSDLLGAVASGLCIIHCALMPVFFVAKPVFEGAVCNSVHCSGFGLIFDYTFMAISFLAVWYSVSHATTTMKWILWSAWVVFTLGLFFSTLGLYFGKWLMYFGSFALIIGHIQNFRYCRRCKGQIDFASIYQKVQG